MRRKRRDREIEEEAADRARREALELREIEEAKRRIEGLENFVRLFELKREGRANPWKPQSS